MTNRCIMGLIWRCLIRANCFFSFTQVDICTNIQLMQIRSLPAVVSHQVKAWTFDDFCFPPLFFPLFFPERRFKGQSDQSSLSERKGGRQRQRKQKRMKTPKRTEECANRAVYTNKSSAPQIWSFFFLFRAKFLSDRLNISIDALSLPVAISISDPQARVHNIAALSWPE